MEFFKKIGVHFDAWKAVKSAITLPEFLDAKSNMLMERAPQGEAPHYLSIQKDGSVIRTEVQQES